MLCQYKKYMESIFGKPKKGIHKYRLFGLAIMDVIMTIIGSFIVKLILEYFDYNYHYFCILLFFFLMGIILHRLFCIRTTIDKILFP